MEVSDWKVGDGCGLSGGGCGIGADTGVDVDVGVCRFGLGSLEITGICRVGVGVGAGAWSNGVNFLRNFLFLKVDCLEPSNQILYW